MLDEAVKLVLPDARTACFCEWEAYAAAVLMARMEDKSLEPAPVWCGDMGEFDAKPFRGVVDIITAGLPCQPYSLAGSRQGNSDKRSFGDGKGPIPNFLRIVSECQPALVFLENVPNWVRSSEQYFRPVGEELCRMGYTLVEPVFIAASDVGASHQRERVFIMAIAESQRIRWRWLSESAGWFCDSNADRRSGELANSSDGQFPQSGRGQEERTGTRPASEAMDNATGTRRDSTRERSATDSESGQCLFGEGCVGLAHAVSERQKGQCEGRPTPETTGRSSRELIFAPGPSDPQWPAMLEESPWIAPAVKPGLRCVVDGNALVVDESRADQLRCTGNGVVALCAAVAFAELLRRAAFSAQGNP